MIMPGNFSGSVYRTLQAEQLFKDKYTHFLVRIHFIRTSRLKCANISRKAPSLIF